MFAFTPPTAPPPGDNVDAPINTGTGDQTKTGGLLSVFDLQVNQSLGVSGGTTLGGILNLQGNKITNVGSPSAAGDAATKGFVDSETSGLQTRVTGSCPVGQGVRAIAAGGSVTCQTIPEGLRSGDVVAAGAMRNLGRSVNCYNWDRGSCVWWGGKRFYSTTEKSTFYNPRGILIYNPGAQITLSGCTNGTCSGDQVVTGRGSMSCTGGFRSGASIIARGMEKQCAAATAWGCTGIACVP